MKARYERAGVLWHCDSCGHEEDVPDDNLAGTDFPARGVAGTCRTGIDGHEFEWYACRSECIGDAVEHAYERVLNGGQS